MPFAPHNYRQVSACMKQAQRDLAAGRPLQWDCDEWARESKWIKENPKQFMCEHGFVKSDLQQIARDAGMSDQGTIKKICKRVTKNGRRSVLRLASRVSHLKSPGKSPKRKSTKKRSSSATASTSRRLSGGKKKPKRKTPKRKTPKRKSLRAGCGMGKY